MSTTYEQLEMAHFTAMSFGNHITQQVARAFVDRNIADLTYQEKQLVYMCVQGATGDVCPSVHITEDGRIINWMDGPGGQEFQALLAEALSEE